MLGYIRQWNGFPRKRERGCAANAETCFYLHIQSVKGGTDQCFISINLCIAGRAIPIQVSKLNIYG